MACRAWEAVRGTARLDSWEQVASKAVREEGRMFGADLTESGVTNHARTRLKAERFCALHDRLSKHFRGSHCECSPDASASPGWILPSSVAGISRGRV